MTKKKRYVLWAVFDHSGGLFLLRRSKKAALAMIPDGFMRKDHGWRVVRGYWKEGGPE